MEKWTWASDGGHTGGPRYCRQRRWCKRHGRKTMAREEEETLAEDKDEAVNPDEHKSGIWDEQEPCPELHNCVSNEPLYSCQNEGDYTSFIESTACICSGKISIYGYHTHGDLKKERLEEDNDDVVNPDEHKSGIWDEGQEACAKLYNCVTNHEPLYSGQIEGDYVAFIETACICGGKLSIFGCHTHEDLMKYWLEEEDNDEVVYQDEHK
ncbi:hypothetical protein L2E82_51744 [Cichorium intybus]|nr:hypothetical protein L2E82_51744 [Cichorium intybus]